MGHCRALGHLEEPDLRQLKMFANVTGDCSDFVRIVVVWRRKR
jgi:hypothetical protein